MNALTKESLYAELVTKIDAEQGYVITLSDEFESELKVISDKIIEITGYDESKLSEADLKTCKEYVEKFNNSCIGGTVKKNTGREDGLLMGSSQEEIDDTLNSLKVWYDAGFYTYGHVLATLLLKDALLELGEFRRF